MGAGSLTGVRFPALLVFACRKEGSGEKWFGRILTLLVVFRTDSSITLQTTEERKTSC